MNQSEAYFISLLCAHLNGISPPPPSDEIDWKIIWSLSQNHHVTGMIAQAVKKLDSKYQPSKQRMSYLNQYLGFTLQNYEMKIRTLSKIKEVLERAETRYLLVKGAVTRELYPAPALRTSGDTDVIVDTENYENVVETLKTNGFTLLAQRRNVSVLKYGDEDIEIHNELESINDKTDELFLNPFDGAISENNGNMYILKPEYSLLYTIIHFLMHIKAGGAGVRMLMDIDVLIRKSTKAAQNHLFVLADEVDITKAVSITFALCKAWFNTPIETDYDLKSEPEFFETITSMILDGGTFGFDNGGAGLVYLTKAMDENKEVTAITRLKALFKYLFPKRSYLTDTYDYAKKHTFLLPFAYINRVFDALFKRKKESFHKLNFILSESDKSNQLNNILNTLEIK